MKNEKLPVLFVGHGSPMNAIEDNTWSKGFKGLSEGIPKPNAILAISAHYYTDGTYTTGNTEPETIHDFGGFPPELYEVQYPVAGDPALANRVVQELSAWHASIKQDWGIDHGTWSVLRHMYPNADIPIVQLSIDSSLHLSDHWEIGESLAPLRDEGVLIIGSGNIVHNLRHAFRKMRNGDNSLESWSIDFDEKATSALERHDKSWLTNALNQELGRIAHPTPDHYIPVLYAAAAGGNSEVSFPIEGFDTGDLSMRAVRFDE